MNRTNRQTNNQNQQSTTTTTITSSAKTKKTKKNQLEMFYPNLIGIAPEATTTLDRVPQGVISSQYARVGVLII